MQADHRRGKFITLEGGEGVGKTTNLAFIQQYLEMQGVRLLVTREPGGTPLGESVRALLLDKQYKGMHPDAELLLVFAARAEHVRNRIEPALEAGYWVLSDRFTDASFAYQGEGRDMGFKRIAELERFVLDDFSPDLTLFLDADIEIGMSRVEQRADKDRFENEDTVFFRKVQAGYRRRAADNPGRMKVINAAQSLEMVQAEIRQRLDEFLSRER